MQGHRGINGRGPRRGKAAVYAAKGPCVRARGATVRRTGDGRHARQVHCADEGNSVARKACDRVFSARTSGHSFVRSRLMRYQMILPEFRRNPASKVSPFNPRVSLPANHLLRRVFTFGHHCHARSLITTQNDCQRKSRSDGWVDENVAELGGARRLVDCRRLVSPSSRARHRRLPRFALPCSAKLELDRSMRRPRQVRPE